MEVQIGGLIGLFGGASFGVFGWWLGRRKAKKNRGLDEVHQYIWQKSRSISWYFTLAAIYLLFSLAIFGMEFRVAMVLGILLLVHMASWGISGIVLSINMQRTEPWRPSKVAIGIVIMAVNMIVFTILSIVTSNWLFLIVSIPPTAIALFTLIIAPKEFTSEDE